MEKENARARVHELEIFKLLMPSPQTQVQGHFDTPVAHGSQGWQSYGPVSTAPPVALPFGHHRPGILHRPDGQQNNNRFPTNTFGASTSSYIPVAPRSNPYTHSQQPGGMALNDPKGDYFKL